MQLRRRSLVVSCVLLFAPLVAVNALEGPERAEASVTAPGPTYQATVTRTEHGIPHIVAEDYASLGFGSGYAAAESSICTLADTLVTGRGQRSLHFGEGSYDDQVATTGTNLQMDTLVGDLRNRQVVEKLLRDPRRGPSTRAKDMVRGYTAGINKWLEENRVTDPGCKDWAFLAEGTLEATPLDLWYGVHMANIIASTGHFVSQIVEASPASLTDPGLPEVPGLPKLPESPTQQEIKEAAAKVDKQALLAALGKDPESAFGSNATAIGGEASTTGKGMLLGNPHFPWRGRFRFTQQHLTIPGKYDVAGASLIGSPAVNIGWNDDVAWSHTVSTAYRFTPYEFVTLPGSRSYITEKGLQRLDRRVVEVKVRQADGTVRTVEEDLYRTHLGYVIDAPEMLMPWGAATLWSIRDANAEHLRTIDAFLAMGGATDVRDLLRRQDRWGGVPWVNTIAADRSGDAMYADHSVTPNVPNNMLLGCMTPVGQVLNLVAGLPGLNGALGNSLCKWKSDADASRPGIFGGSSMPDVVRRDWVANANDSYWLPHPDQRLEGYPKIMGCEKCERTLRTRMVYAYPADALERGKISPAMLASFQFANRVMGAEVMRAGGKLDAVCEAADGGDACAALRSWDGHSDRGSVGNHIFEEFVKRLPAKGYWKVPFSVDDPLNTPRDLDATHKGVIAAMAGAIDFLRRKGVPMTAEWGSLQAPGDRGAAPIELGGGTHPAGNANVVTSRNPQQNKEFLSAITYGSSHIQSIAFLAEGGLSARTLLTYGQSENPLSPWSMDQTRLYADEQWVRFPWTDAEIARQQVSRRVLTAP